MDSAVPDSQKLTSGLLSDGDPSTRIVYLDPNRSGVEQITDALAGCRDLAAIHIFSHGDSGSLLLGNGVVDIHTMEQHVGDLKAWGKAFAAGGDLLLYGCNVARGDAGIDFLNRLGELTGADVAASNDPTGHAVMKGDWDLEFSRGSIEAAPALGASVRAGYTHVLQFTVVVLPDTQKYAEQQLQPFVDQTEWIANHAASENIAFVSHVGDVVENGALYESEWLFADAAMDVLDGTDIPYAVTVGNHDYDVPGTHSTITRFAGLDAGGNPDPALADISFGSSRYEGESWFVGASPDGLNYCQIFTADGQDYLHIALEWEPRPSSIEWAQQQIDAHPELPVILSTHYYIDPLVNGYFQETYSDDGCNGQELFEALVYPNPQIFMVLSGHNTEWHKVSTNEAGFQVIEMMADYQSRVNGGNGWMQLITFDPDQNRIGVQTYSPTLDQYEVDANSQFSFDFDFDQRFNFLLAPMAALVEPADQGPDDLDPAYDAVVVNTGQSRFRIQLTDANDAIDDATVTSQSVVITRNDVVLTESVDYSFSYDPATDQIAITPIGGVFGDGFYEIMLNGGDAKIADVGGHELTTDLLTVEIDTSIPQTVVFQQGVNGYAGTLDTHVRGSAADAEYSTSTSITVDGENSGKPVHGLLRFDNLFGSEPGQIPAGSQINSAQLELTVADPGNALKFHRMLRDWIETATWNTLGTGIQADDMEAVSAADAITAEVSSGKLIIDVTASLRAWANNPSANFGWAILPTAPNGVMLDSSEGAAPPKLTVTFGGTIVDTTPPSGTLVVPLDQGPNDHNPAEGAVVVNTTQPHLCVQLEDEGQGIDDATVTSQTAVIRKNDVVLTESVDYSFSYDPATDRITITPIGGSFDDGLYDITLNGGDAKIADVAGNPLITTTLNIEIDTSVSIPQTVIFQQGVNGYTGTFDTHIRGSAADSEFSTSTSITVDGENSGKPVHGLLRFDSIFGSGSGQIPAGSQINSAQLELTVTDPGNALKFHRMLRDWAETETWNTLGTGIQANDIEAVSAADATTAEVAAGKLIIDVTASLRAWVNNPSANFGWAILPTAPNGVMLDSSEGVAPPKLTVTFAAASANNPPTVALANTVTTLPENTGTSVRIKVADIVVTDDGEGTNLLSLGGADAGLFEIDGAELYLKAGVSLDYETNPVLDVAVLVDDTAVGATPDSAATLAIAIGDINEPPIVTLANTVTTLAENTDTSVRTKIADILVTDDASGANILNLGGTDASLFEIDGTGLYLRAGVVLDSDTQPVLDVAVLVDDPATGAAPDSTATLAIAITDANEPPVVTLTNTTTTLAEDVDTGVRIKVADIAVTDDGSGTNILSLDGTDAALFEIDGTALYLKAGTALNHEASPILDVTVLVDDPAVGAAPDSMATLVIAITDVNEPPAVTLTNTTTTLAENVDTSIRVKVADITVTDDASGTNILSLGGADAALFEIDGTALYLKAGIVLDHETHPVLDVVVLVDDPAVGVAPDSEAALAIDVTPVVETQTVTFQQNVDGYTGTLDTQVLGDAPDRQYSTSKSIRVDGKNVTYPAHGLLKFADLFGSGPGQIPVGAQILSAQIELTVADGGQPLTFHRMLRDWVETETWNTLVGGIQADDIEAVGVADATTGSMPVGTLVVDVTSSLLAWANDPSTNFGWAVLPTGTDSVVFGSSEFSATPKLTVTFGTSSINASATIALANVQTTLAEDTDTSVRVKIADIVVTDDGSGTNALSLGGADAALFEIEGTELYLKAGVILDYETDGDLDVEVMVDDPAVGGTPDSTAALTIAIADANEPPTVALANTITILPENSDTSVRTKVADIVVTDDASGANTLSLDGTDAALFEIDGTELYLKAGATLNRETNPVLDVAVLVDDSTVGATPDSVAALAIAIADVNEPPTVTLANTVTALAENADTSARIKVADIVAADDTSGTNVMSLTGADAALFEIDGTELYLKAGTSLDYESHPSLNVTVAIDDAMVGTSPDDTAALTIGITDVSEAMVYYVSQSGTGDGAAADAPASISSFNAGAGPFGTLDGATIYFIGTITTTITPSDSGTAESRVVLRGDYTGQPCTIDGANTLAVGIDIANTDYVSVVGFTVQNTTTSAIHVGSEAIDAVIEGCTIVQTAGHAIAFEGPITITGNTITATGGTESLYSQLGTSGGMATITGNTLNFNHASSGLYIRGYGDHIITSNDINLSAGPATVLTASGTGSETGSIQFSGNDVDSSVAPGGAMVSLVAGNWAATISDNAFDLTSPAFASPVIYLSGLAAPVITGNTVSVADDVPCIYLAGNGRGEVATITHNVLTHTGGAGAQYVIRVGNETENSYQYTYDGVVITDNRIAGFTTTGGCHAVFVGFNRNAVIARNYVSNAGYGIVVKGTEGTDYTAGGVLYNVIFNCDIGIRIKGVDDVVVANNTVYSPHALIITGNVGGDESTGVILKNNILSGTGGCLLQIGSETDLSTLAASDYAANCLYVYAPGDYVKHQGVAYTYAGWVALGYDSGSINADPLFTNLAMGDLTLLAGSPCIDAGTNLGDLYDDALAPSSTWPFVTILDQDDYGSAWDIGAYLVS